LLPCSACAGISSSGGEARRGTAVDAGLTPLDGVSGFAAAAFVVAFLLACFALLSSATFAEADEDLLAAVTVFGFDFAALALALFAFARFVTFDALRFAFAIRL